MQNAFPLSPIHSSTQLLAMNLNHQRLRPLYTWCQNCLRYTKFSAMRRKETPYQLWHTIAFCYWCPAVNLWTSKMKTAVSRGKGLSVTQTWDWASADSRECDPVSTRLRFPFSSMQSELESIHCSSPSSSDLHVHKQTNHLQIQRNKALSLSRCIVFTWASKKIFSALPQGTLEKLKDNCLVVTVKVSDVNKTFLSRPRPRPQYFSRPRPRLFGQDQGETFYFKTKTKTKTLLGPLHRLRYNGHKMNTTVYTRHRQLCMT